MEIRFSVTDKGITLNYELDTETAPYYYINELCEKLRDAANDLEAAKLKKSSINTPKDTLTSIANSLIGKPNTSETKEELKEQISEAILEKKEDVKVESALDRTESIATGVLDEIADVAGIYTEPKKESEETITPIADLEKIVQIVEETEKAPEIYRNKKKIFDAAGELINRLWGSYDPIDIFTYGYSPTELGTNTSWYEPNNPQADYRKYIHHYYRSVQDDLSDPCRIQPAEEEFTFWQERLFKRVDALVEVSIERIFEDQTVNVRIFVDGEDYHIGFTVKQIYQPESFFHVLIDESRPLKEILDYCSYDIE